MAIGVAVLLICGYFAEKSATFPSIIGGHEALWDTSRSRWTCREAGCGFETRWAVGRREYRADVQAHRLAAGGTIVGAEQPLPGRSPQVAAAVPGVDQPTGGVPPTKSLPSTPDFKTCPDCAEQVRYAARKCRFCGYSFEQATD